MTRTPQVPKPDSRAPVPFSQWPISSPAELRTRRPLCQGTRPVTHVLACYKRATSKFFFRRVAASIPSDQPLTQLPATVPFLSPHQISLGAESVQTMPTTRTGRL